MPWEFTLMDRALAELVRDGSTEETISKIEALRKALTPRLWVDYSFMLSHYGVAQYLYDNVARKQQVINSQ